MQKNNYYLAKLFLANCLFFVSGGYAMKLMSPAFKHGQPIGQRYTCDGQDASPELLWEGVPPKTKSFVLIVDDPDAPKKTWVHWLVYNIPATVRRLEENVRVSSLGGAQEGVSDSGKPQFYGPCPPKGEHRYFFKLFALDAMLTLPSRPTVDQLMKAMKGHVLDKAELMGTYKRSK